MHQYFLTQINWGGPLCTTQRLKPICYKLLSSCAFSFNLRRYIKDRQKEQNRMYRTHLTMLMVKEKENEGDRDRMIEEQKQKHEVGRCMLIVSKPVLKAPMVSALEATIW
jgi:hypothetical protein